jgi:hypothetical protein
VGQFDATTGEGRSVQIDIVSDDKVFHFCNQDMAQYHPRAFPALPPKNGEEWMTDEQAKFARIFGFTSVAVLVSAILIVLNQTRRKLKAIFVTTFKVRILVAIELFSLAFVSFLLTNRFQSHGKAGGVKNFNTELGAYIPSTKLVKDIFPILFCDISNIDEELIPWVDPEKSYDYHNAIFDIPELEDKPVFSTIHHWPPPK